MISPHVPIKQMGQSKWMPRMVSSRPLQHTEVCRILRKNTSILAFIAMAVLMVLSATSGAQVIDSSGTASIDVQPALTLSLVASPDWGKVVKPAAGTARYKLDYGTGAVTLVSGNGYAFDNGQNGE